MRESCGRVVFSRTSLGPLGLAYLLRVPDFSRLPYRFLRRRPRSSSQLVLSLQPRVDGIRSQIASTLVLSLHQSTLHRLSSDLTVRLFTRLQHLVQRPCSDLKMPGHRFPPYGSLPPMLRSHNTISSSPLPSASLDTPEQMRSMRRSEPFDPEIGHSQQPPVHQGGIFDDFNSMDMDFGQYIPRTSTMNEQVRLNRSSKHCHLSNHCRHLVIPSTRRPCSSQLVIRPRASKFLSRKTLLTREAGSNTLTPTIHGPSSSHDKRMSHQMLSLPPRHWSTLLISRQSNWSRKLMFYNDSLP